MDATRPQRQPAADSDHDAAGTGRPLRIEMMAHGLIAAGMEMVIARLTRALMRRGHDVGITCIEFIGPLGERLREEGIRVSLVRAPGMKSLLRPLPIYDWLRKVQPDVVHVHSGAWVKAARGAAMAGVPCVVYTLHGLEGGEPWWDPLACAFAARHTDAIAVVAEPLRRHLRRARIAERRIHVVPNGIDISVFRPAADRRQARAAFDVPADRLVIGHVARFAPVKNHVFLVDAFVRIARRVPSAHLVLAGDGPLHADIRARVEAAGLVDRVTFTGDVDDAARLYRSFDVFVLTSVTEGTSMSILEAMATGLPVVASAVGGTPDLLAGRAGLLFPSGDADAFVGSVEGLLADPGLRAEYGQRARDRVISSYGEDVMVERYESLYHARVGRRGPAMV